MIRTQSNKRAIVVILTVVMLLVSAVCIISVFLLRSQLGNKQRSTSTVQITGASMEPNFLSGQIIQVEEVPLADLSRGDVVVYQRGEGRWLKRLVGLPGESVEIRDSTLFIDGVAVNEPYEITPARYSTESITLGENEYYVLGDNRNNSLDSHAFGPLSGDDIVGRLVP